MIRKLLHRLNPLSKPSTTLVALVAEAAPFDPAKGADGLPQRFRVLPWGDNQTAKGLVRLNSNSVAKFPAYMQAKNWDAVPLDFEHNTVQGSPAFDPMGKVAGYGTIEIVEGDGAYLSMSSWTEDGKTLAAGGHFRDLSATVVLNEAQEVIGIHSVALCRHGAAPGATFCLSSDWEWPEQRRQAPQTAEDLYLALRDALQLTSDATPQDVAGALAAMFSEKEKTTTETQPNEPNDNDDMNADLTALQSAMTEQGKRLDAALAAIEKLTTGVTALSSTVETVSKQRDDSEREMILSAAAAEGKVVPASAKTLPIETLRTLCSELEPTVPMELRGTHVQTLSSTATGDYEHPIDRLVGVTKDDRAKFLNPFVR